MKIAVFGQTIRNAEASIELLLNYLQKKGIEVFIESDFFDLIIQNKGFGDHKTFNELDSFPPPTQPVLPDFERR